MEVEEAKILLGFPPNSRPDPSQVSSSLLFRLRSFVSFSARFSITEFDQLGFLNLSVF